MARPLIHEDADFLADRIIERLDGRIVLGLPLGLGKANHTLRNLCGGDIPQGRETGSFERGLYAASEMFVDGFMEIYRAGVLKRKAADGALLHSGFFLGTEAFYRFLRELMAEGKDSSTNSLEVCPTSHQHSFVFLS